MFDILLNLPTPQHPCDQLFLQEPGLKQGHCFGGKVLYKCEKISKWMDWVNRIGSGFDRGKNLVFKFERNVGLVLVFRLGKSYRDLFL